MEELKCRYVGRSRRALAQNKPSSILIERVDNIGDVVLSVPVADALKRRFPGCKIVFMLRKYTKDLLEFFEDVDDVILYEDLISMDRRDAVNYLKEQNFSHFISLHNKRQVLSLAKAAKIPVRIANSRVWYNWFYANVLPEVSRSKLGLHEAQVNMRLASPMGIDVPSDLTKLIPEVATVVNPQSGISELAETDPRFKLALHPASNKNGREWPEENFVSLIKSLDPQMYKIFITGSLAEKERLPKLAALKQDNVINIMGELSLLDWYGFLHQINGFVAAGTGPLHLAAAMGVPTLGLFPRKKSVSVGRWQPLGKRAAYLMYPHECRVESCTNNNCPCMQAISTSMVEKTVLGWKDEL